MSKVGKHPVQIPNGVSALVDGNFFIASHKSSTARVFIPDGVSVAVSGAEITVSVRDVAEKRLRALWGTIRALISNAVKGLAVPFEKRIDLVGVGYKAAVSGSSLDLQLAYSHGVSLAIPEGISVKVDKQTAIFVSSSDKQKLGAFLRKIQSYRPPEPYKGKGAIIEGQYVYRKEGKKK